MIWHQNLLDRITAQGTGPFVLDLPVYRPDLMQDLAAQTGCTFLDFRARYLAPLQFQAHTLPLAAIISAIVENSNESGVILQNAEALLAAKPAAERIAWLESFLRLSLDSLAILPLALFGRELADHPRLVRFSAAEVPDESLILRLSSLRLS